MPVSPSSFHIGSLLAHSSSSTDVGLGSWKYRELTLNTNRSSYSCFEPNVSSSGPLILGHVFSFLEYKDALQASLVCRVWCLSFVQAPQIYIQSCPLTAERMLLRILWRHSLLHYLSVTFQATDSDNQFHDFISHIPSSHMLHSLELRKCAGLAQPEIFSPTIKRLRLLQCKNVVSLHLECPLLVKLNLTDCVKISDSELEKTLSMCPNLESLILNGCSELRQPTITLPKLKYLDLGDCDELSVPQIDCPQLEHLILRSNNLIDDAGLCSVLYTPHTCDQNTCLATHLKILDLSNSALLVSPKISCKNIEYLNLSNSQKVDEPTIVCHNIKSLFLNDIALLQDQFFTRFFSEAHYHLTEMYLKSCKDLFSPDVSSPCLEILDFNDCSALYSPKIDCPKLVHLKFLKCSRLKDSAVAQAVSSSEYLQYLNVSHCGDLANPTIASDSLEVLDMIECQSLKKPVVVCSKLVRADLSYTKSMRDHAVSQLVQSCPSLQVLCLRGCGSLKDPVIESSSLLILEMSMCRKLSRPQFVCPKLLRVDILNCPSLKKESIDEMMEECFKNAAGVAMSSGVPVCNINMSDVLTLNIQGSCLGITVPESPGSTPRTPRKDGAPAHHSDSFSPRKKGKTIDKSPRDSPIHRKFHTFNASSTTDPLAQANLKYLRGQNLDKKKDCVIS